jgi:hypothetical protein
MKPALIILLIVIASCHHLDKAVNKEALNDSTVTITKNKPNGSDAIPSWIRKLYEVNNGDYTPGAVPVVEVFKPLSDSISYCLYVVSDETCLMTFVATQKYQKPFKDLQIGNACDADFSIPAYYYTTYEYDSGKASFLSVDHTETAKDSYLSKDHGGTHFKKGYTLENAETIKDSVVKKISVDGLGNISSELVRY